MLDMPTDFNQIWTITDKYEETPTEFFLIKCIYCDNKFRSNAIDGYGSHLLFSHSKVVSMQSLGFIVETLEKEKERQKAEKQIPYTKSMVKKNFRLNNIHGMVRFKEFWNRIERIYLPKPFRSSIYYGLDDVSRNFCLFMTFVNQRRRDLERHSERYYHDTAFKTFWNAVELPVKKQITYKHKVERLCAKNKWRYQNDAEFRRKRNEASKLYHQLHPEVSTKAWKRYAEKRRIKRDQNVREDIVMP